MIMFVAAGSGGDRNARSAIATSSTAGVELRAARYARSLCWKVAYPSASATGAAARSVVHAANANTVRTVMKRILMAMLRWKDSVKETARTWRLAQSCMSAGARLHDDSMTREAQTGR